MNQSLRNGIAPPGATSASIRSVVPPLFRHKRLSVPSKDTPRLLHRTIFLSDIHLGTRASRADLLLEFLRTHSAETLYLVGDIVDNWFPLSGNWKPAHHQVLQQIFELPRTGTRVVYVPGNHDDFFRNYAGQCYGGIEVELNVDHHAINGLRYLVTHGDTCDVFSVKSPFLERAGRLTERIALGVDVAQRRLRKAGQPAWFGIERAITSTSTAIRKFDNFEERLSDLAKSGGYDGIVCGHFHRPALHGGFGITYANCGDWTGSNTAIVEDFEGRLDLIRCDDKPAVQSANATDGETMSVPPFAA